MLNSSSSVYGGECNDEGVKEGDECEEMNGDVDDDEDVEVVDNADCCESDVWDCNDEDDEVDDDEINEPDRCVFVFFLFPLVVTVWESLSIW